jgi:hypothetical protein
VRQAAAEVVAAASHCSTAAIVGVMAAGAGAEWGGAATGAGDSAWKCSHPCRRQALFPIARASLFGVQIIRGLYAIGGPPERIGLAMDDCYCIRVWSGSPGLTSWVILSSLVRWFYRSISNNVAWKRKPSLCHLDRNEAEGPAVALCPSDLTAPQISCQKS